MKEQTKLDFLKPLSKILTGKYIIYIAIQILFTTYLPSQTEYGSRRVNTVVIDPGHGGRDPGALGKFSKEKEITLSIALKLGKLINQRFPEVKVVYTRNDDRFVELYQRAETANKAKADLFISIHANSTVKPGPSGVEFWVLGLHKADENLEVVKKENAALQFEQDVRKNYGFDPNSPEGSIIMTMQQNLYLDQSIQFAKLLESRFVKEDNQLNRGSKQAGFIVLYKTSMPSVLVEVGFISNPDEEQYIANETGQTKIAVNLANAFADYKLKYESGAIKQVAVNTTPKPANSLLSEPTVSGGGGFSQSGSFGGPIVDSDNSIPEAEVIKKEPTANLSKPIIEDTGRDQKKKILVDEEVEKYQPKSNLIDKTELLATPKTAPALDPNTKPSALKKPSSTIISPNASAKKIVLEDDAKSLKNQSEKAVVSSNVGSKKSSSKDTVKYEPKLSTKINTKTETQDKSLGVKSESTKMTTKLNTSTPGKIKIEESSALVPSYVADKEIKKEIVDNTKKINKTDDILENNVLPTVKESPAIAASKSDVKEKSLSVNTTKNSTTSIIFKVQVKAASAKIQKTDPLYALHVNLEESFEGGLYKYLVGSFSTDTDAKVQLEKLRNQGVKDAFVVKYKDGVRVK